MAHHCQQGRHRLYPRSLPREGEPVGGRKLIAITVPARSSGFWGRGRHRLPGTTSVTDRSIQAASGYPRFEPRRPKSDTFRPPIPQHRASAGTEKESSTQPIPPASNLLFICFSLILGWNFFVIFTLHFVSPRRMGGRGRLHGAVWRDICPWASGHLHSLSFLLSTPPIALHPTHNITSPMSFLLAACTFAF